MERVGWPFQHNGCSIRYSYTQRYRRIYAFFIKKMKKVEMNMQKDKKNNKNNKIEDKNDKNDKI